MAETDFITNDEEIIRHIPPGSIYVGTGPSVTSANFSLRKDLQETGVSVTRLKITSPVDLLRNVGGDVDKGSRIAKARVGDVRAIGLEVVPCELPHDKGHAEIRSATSDLTRRSVRRALADLFQFIELTSTN